jgi:hypothetical protein
MPPSSTHAGKLVDLFNDFLRGRIGRARYLVLGFVSSLQASGRSMLRNRRHGAGA